MRGWIWVRPWALASWTFLTLGITLGSFWAYYELGWGGWWFWDPVENLALLPWILGTALIHSLQVVKAQRGLIGWALLFNNINFPHGAAWNLHRSIRAFDLRSRVCFGS